MINTNESDAGQARIVGTSTPASAPSSASASAPEQTMSPRGDASQAPRPASGAVWRLAEPTRGLDANVIALPPGTSIDEHAGPGLDVLIHVVDGTGTISRGKASTPLDIAAGDLVWLPGDARRGFAAGADGLRYLTVHARKPGLQIGSRAARPDLP